MTLTNINKYELGELYKYLYGTPEQQASVDVSISSKVNLNATVVISQVLGSLKDGRNGFNFVNCYTNLLVKEDFDKLMTSLADFNAFMAGDPDMFYSEFESEYVSRDNVLSAKVNLRLEAY